MTYTLSPTLATTISVELTAVENQLTKDYGTKTSTTLDGNNWSVNLTRMNDSLTVSVTWTTNNYANQTYNSYSGGYRYGSTQHCPYESKDVTWEELLVASDHYGVKDLKSQCENKVITAMNRSSVVETLFTIGCSFDKIKESALNYIVDNMATLFTKDKDSFEQYKNHPRCYEMLVEVIRRKAEGN
ncbi:hypothetical protein BGX26_001995 [Mortierella sp. AD094]|nr:hypothetical protein BGX26_001995 [Mortierella sp. AD094]